MIAFEAHKPAVALVEFNNPQDTDQKHKLWSFALSVDKKPTKSFDDSTSCTLQLTDEKEGGKFLQSHFRIIPRSSVTTAGKIWGEGLKTR